MKVLLVTERKTLLQQIRRELPELELIEDSGSIGELRFDGSAPDLLILDQPLPEELVRMDDLLLQSIPVILLERASDRGEVVPSLPPGRGGGSLREPWSWDELRALLMLARRGGRYVEADGAGAASSGAAIDAVSSGADTPETGALATREQREDMLSAREMEVLRKLAEGWTNRGIAGSLGISENTVKFHLSGIFRKLGAESRTEAIIVAAHRGLLAL